MILKLNASALTHSLGCPRAMYYELNGYTSLHGRQTPELTFGSAVHIFVEEFLNTKDSLRAIARAKKLLDDTELTYSSKNQHLRAPKLMEACASVEEFLTDNANFDILGTVDPISGQEKVLCELKLAEPIIQDDEDAIMLCGTIDLLVKYRNNGPFCIVDWKTTQSYDIDKYLSSYKLSTQMLMYRWFIRRLAQKFGSDSVYAKMGNNICNRIFAVSTSVANMGVVTPSDLFTFNESIIDTFDRLLLGKAAVLWAAMKSGELPSPDGLATGACTGKFQPCLYTPLCGAPSDDVRDAILKQRFRVVPYDPLTFR